MLPHVRRPMSSDKRCDMLHLLQLQRKQVAMSPESSVSNQSPTNKANAPSKFQTVVVATADLLLACPHCDTVFDDEILLRSHVFRCRMDHGVDPLLPLNILYRRSRPEGTSADVSQRRVHSAQSRFSSSSTTMQSVHLGDDLTSIMRPIEGSTDISCRQLISPRLSSRVPAPPPRSANRPNFHHVANVYGTPRATAHAHHISDATCWREPLRVLLSKTVKIIGGTFPVSSQLISSLSAFLHVGDAEALALDISMLDVVLQSDTALLARLLAPCRKAEALPLVSFDVSKCTFEHFTAEETLLEALKRHPTIQHFVADGTHWRLRGRHRHHHGSSDDSASFPLLEQVHRQCAANRTRARLAESENHLQAQAAAFKSWQMQQIQERQKIERLAQSEATDMAGEEVVERKAMYDHAARAAQLQLLQEKKRRIRERKEFQRSELVVVEERARGRMSASFISLLLHILEQLETAARKEVNEERELCRLRLRVEDREDVFRGKIVEFQRVEREAMERLQIEDNLQVIMIHVMNESADEMEHMGKQKARHKAYTQWKRRQKEELDLLVRQEKVARETIKAEEDAYFISGREKLTRTVESIQIRYATQRENAETSEQNVRTVLEKSMVSWMQLSLHFFESESRLIAVWLASASKEAARLDALRVLPTLHIEAAMPPLILFGAASPGHGPPEPIQLFSPAAKLELSMGAEWQQRLQEITQRCKRSAQDEASAFSDHMQSLNRFCRLYRDSYAIAFETPLEELRATYMQPLTRMQQIMSAGAASTAQKASVSPPFGNWTPNPEDLPGSLQRNKSKRKLSVAPLPIETVTDPVFLELSQQALRWRGAWHDRYSPNLIKNEKEAIRHAFVELSIDEAVTSPHSPSRTLRPSDVLEGSHRLHTRSKRTHYVDEVLVVPESSPRDPDSSSPITSPRTETSLTEFEQATSANVSACPELGATHTLRVEIRHPNESVTASNDALESSLSSGVTTPCSNVSAPLKAKFGGSAALTVEDICNELHQLLYQCVVGGADMQQRGGCGLVKISFTIAATVAVSSVYCDASPAPDVFGYCPKMPNPNTHTVVIETRGSFSIGVVPSCFVVVPTGVPLPIEQPPRVLVEKQMDEVVVFPQLFKIEGPLQVQRSKMSTMTANVQDAVQGFAGGTLTIEVVGGSTSDRLSLRDELPTCKFDCHEKSRAIKTITLNGTTLGEVVDGAIQSTKFVLSSNNLQLPPYVVISLKDQLSASTRISPDNVKTILSRLRYHNFDSDPQEGKRVIRVTLRAANGAQSVLDTVFEVETIDKPTELRIAFQKLTHRAPYLSCPPALRGSLANTFLPVFPQCVVFDEDTDLFSGGGLKLTLQNGVKGDSLVFVPDTRVLSHVDEMLDTLPVLRMVNQNQVCFDDRIVATMTDGNVALDQEFLESSSANETSILRFEFAYDDQCSISAVQAILRHCAFVSLNPGMKLQHNTTQQREVVCELQIQDNEQPTHITETVSIRAAGHSLQLPDKAAVIDFKEGSPPIKIGNIDVSNDRVKPITNFSGAQLLVYVADGYTEGDSVGLKQDDTEYRVAEPKRAGGKLKGRVSLKDKVKQAASLERGPPSPQESTTGVSVSISTPPQPSLTGPLSNSGATITKLSMGDVVTAAASQRVRTKYDITFAGMSTAMATMQSTKCGGLLITMQRDTKKDAVTRKHVTTILRNLTFFSPPNPSIGFKVIRCLFSDEPAASFTQVLVGVRLESVDDVTEIRMKSPRKACLQQPEANFPLCPYGRSILVDEDTEFLDGGSFTVQCVAGSSRGDFFSIVPPSQQAALPLQRQGNSVDGFTGTAYNDLVYHAEERTFLLGDNEVGRVDTTARDGGVAEIRIAFSRDPQGGKPRLVPLQLASYMMNSVLFGNAVEKLRDTSRQFQLRIKDAENPIEGKCKLQLELLPPHMTFASPGTPAAPLLSSSSGPSSAVSPAVSATTESSFRCRCTIGSNLQSVCNPGARIQVQCDTLHENKSSGGSAGGSITVSGRQEDRVRLTVPQSYLDENGLTIHPDTGDVCFVESKQFLFRLTKRTSLSLAFDLRPASSGQKVKPMTKSIMQGFFRAVQILVESPLEDIRRRSISATVEASDQDETTSLGNNVVPNLQIDEPSDSGRRRTSLGGPVSPQQRVLQVRSPRGSISPVTRMLMPRPRSALSTTSFDEEEDESLLVVRFALHDGKNLSQLTTLVGLKR